MLIRDEAPAAQPIASPAARICRPPHHWGRGGGEQGSEQARQESQEGGGRPEGDADADRRQEAGKGVRSKKAAAGARRKSA